MKKFLEITSNLESLKLKEFEKKMYESNLAIDFVLPKIVPLSGYYIDMLFVKNNRLLFVKCIETNEDIFDFLDEEILEIIGEEYKRFNAFMEECHPDVSVNLVYLMPNIGNIENYYSLGEEIKGNIIFGDNCEKLIEDEEYLDSLFGDENSDVLIGTYLFSICPEYFVYTKGLSFNDNVKKLSFSNSDISYKLCMMTEEQIKDVCSANYGNHLISGGSATGKTSIMLARAVKLARIYPHHNFLFVTYSKQQRNKLLEVVDMLGVDTSNLKIHTVSSFFFKIARANNLVIDYNSVKKNYDKAFANIIKQVSNSVKNKRLFKGIFLDEAENINEDELLLLYEFLYMKKRVFNVSICKSYNINNNLNIYKCKVKNIEYEDELMLEDNFRQSEEICEYVNDFCDRSNAFIRSLRDNIATDVYMKTRALYKTNKSVNLVRVEDLDEQLNAIVWEINHLINDLGYKPDEIAVVFPYNKKKLKNGNMIYFQYMLKKTLSSSNIDFEYANEYLTEVVPKIGVTISNIYTIKSIRYKAIILCELEMLYNQSIVGESPDYQVNDFVGDLNKVYLAISRADEYLCIVSSYSDKNSDISNIIMDSEESKSE